MLAGYIEHEGVEVSTGFTVHNMHAGFRMTSLTFSLVDTMRCDANMMFALDLLLDEWT